VMGSWHIVGAFHGNLEALSVGGRMGDIRDRPNQADLDSLTEMTTSILKSLEEGSPA